MDTITVREVRTEILKLTLDELSKKMGITRAALCRKERGEREFKAKEILFICKLADIDPMTLEV